MNDSERHAELADYPSVITLPVQWGDQDAFGHVNNVIYFRWFESSRIDYMTGMGLGHDVFQGDGVGPILAAIGCDYRRQLNFPDTVQVGARVERIGRSSLDICHKVVSLAQDTVVAEGKSTVVVFSYQTQKPQPVPDEIRAAIKKAEGQTF